MLNEIKKSFLSHQSELFDSYFLDQALQDMMPNTENDFNNFKDTVNDKYNRPGYLIQRGKYYIFQPFNENEYISMYYRQHVGLEYNNMVSLENYIKTNYKNLKYKDDTENNKNVKSKIESYDFDSVMDYYENREENFIIGIIDKNNNKLASDDNDLFKIRPPLPKKVDKKRGTGINTFKGAVCNTSKDKKFLVDLIKKIPNVSKEEITKINLLKKEDICVELKNKLLFLEKYSKTENKNKMTYVMVPANHPIYPFPYNLQDRIKNYIEMIIKLSGSYKIDITTKNIKNGEFMGERKIEYPKYELSFSNTYFKDKKEELEKIGGVLNKNTWTIILE